MSEATHVAQRIQQALMLPFTLSGQEIFTTASIGIALSATGYHQPEDLLRDADAAMYQQLCFTGNWFGCLQFEVGNYRKCAHGKS